METRGRRRTPNPNRPQESLEFGRLLRLARERSNRTQSELASALGINLTTLAKYEVGIYPTPARRAGQLAALLNAPELFPSVGQARHEVAKASIAIVRTTERGGDAFDRRGELFDWWCNRQIELRNADKIDTTEMSDLRRRLAGRLVESLRDAGAALADASDDALTRICERELQAILQNRRELSPLITTAA